MNTSIFKTAKEEELERKVRELEGKVSQLEHYGRYFPSHQLAHDEIEFSGTPASITMPILASVTIKKDYAGWRVLGKTKTNKEEFAYSIFVDDVSLYNKRDSINVLSVLLQKAIVTLASKLEYE